MNVVGAVNKPLRLPRRARQLLQRLVRHGRPSCRCETGAQDSEHAAAQVRGPALETNFDGALIILL